MLVALHQIWVTLPSSVVYRPGQPAHLAERGELRKLEKNFYAPV